MLTPEEREELEQDLIFEQKRVMKEMLNIGKMVSRDDLFDSFRTDTFNKFGKSGLETKTKKILDKYSDDERRR